MSTSTYTYPTPLTLPPVRGLPGPQHSAAHPSHWRDLYDHAHNLLVLDYIRSEPEV